MRPWPLALALFSLPASAELFTVDDDGPADFAGIADALASPLVQDGDTLLVEPGLYLGFDTAGRALTILGTGASPSDVSVRSVRILDTPAGARVVVANLAPTSVTIGESVGRVVLQDLDAGPLVVRGSDDVHAEGSTFDGGLDDTPALGLVVEAGSTASFTRCVISGGADRRGAEVQVDAVVEFVGCRIVGGDGGATDAGSDTGKSGALGLFSAGDVTLRGPLSSVRGGNGQVGPAFDGQGAPAFGAFVDGVLRYSRTELVPGVSPAGVPAPAILQQGALQVQPELPDPALFRRPGATDDGRLHLVAFGVEGELVTTFVGRRDLAVELPGVLGTRCTDVVAVVGTRLLVGTNATELAPLVPPGLEPGTTVFFQSVVASPDRVQLTNCVPGVLR